jgi:hypothetical protein
MLVRSIAGYDYGKAQPSPVTLDDFKRLQAVVGFTDDDRQSLRDAGELLANEAETLVDGWRKIIGSQDHLSEWFCGPDVKPDDDYKAAVKPRLVQWVVDTFKRRFDQDWLDYQEEIGLRDTPAKKQQDGWCANASCGPAAPSAGVCRSGPRRYAHASVTKKSFQR